MKNATSLGLPAGRHIWHQLGQSAWHAVCTVIVAALAATAFGTVSPAIAAPPATVKLPPPQTDGGKPLMQALKQRHTSREFKSKQQPQQNQTNQQKTTNRKNRPGSGGRTAPTTHDAQDIDVYVVTAQGTYRYEARAHSLIGVRTGELRALTGIQDFVKD